VRTKTKPYDGAIRLTCCCSHRRSCSLSIVVSRWWCLFPLSWCGPGDLAPVSRAILLRWRQYVSGTPRGLSRDLTMQFHSGINETEIFSLDTTAARVTAAVRRSGPVPAATWARVQILASKCASLADRARSAGHIAQVRRWVQQAEAEIAADRYGAAGADVRISDAAAAGPASSPSSSAIPAHVPPHRRGRSRSRSRSRSPVLRQSSNHPQTTAAAAAAAASPTTLAASSTSSIAPATASRGVSAQIDQDAELAIALQRELNDVVMGEIGVASRAIGPSTAAAAAAGATSSSSSLLRVSGGISIAELYHVDAWTGSDIPCFTEILGIIGYPYVSGAEFLQGDPHAWRGGPQQQRRVASVRTLLQGQHTPVEGESEDARLRADVERAAKFINNLPLEIDLEQERWRYYQQQQQSSAAKEERSFELNRSSDGAVATAASAASSATAMNRREPIAFHELANSTAPSTLQYEPAPLDLTSYPIDWFVKDSVPSQLTCPICCNVVFDPPNLETCGQITQTAPAHVRGRNASLRVHRVCMRRRHSCGTPHSLLRSSVSSCHLSSLSQRMASAQG
jgi:hypothetical protein